MDKEIIKKALDDFESENYVDAKETLTTAIRQEKDAYLQTKLSLKQDDEE
jgi:hypothetical protein